MPNFSGIWNATEQFQARAQNIWPATPGAPTIGTATAGSSQASVAFTAPAYTGYPAGVSSYTAISTPGCITASGAASPVVVTGLTNGTAYTFRVRATGASGTGPLSAASNSVTPVEPVGQQAYITVGTFSWVAPTGVTRVSVVAVGSGGSSENTGNGGGGLGYRNNIAVTPGNSYTVVVGGKGPSSPAPAFPGQDSYFCSTSVVKGGGGGIASTRAGGTFTGDGGGNGGSGGCTSCYTGGGGGAGGYAGTGGSGGGGFPNNGTAGSGGAGGGGASEGGGYNAGGGGGVGILGQGSNGAGGVVGSSFTTRGRGGSGGADGSFKTGGAYGGGSTPVANGGTGAVRIIWPGTTRSFPSTNTGDL
jgi:hypothetical protein